jgi:hypothetical protein
MIYFTNVGGPGRVTFRQIPASIAVMDQVQSGALIGTALASGQTDDGFALWSLRVRDSDVPGRWIIVDRKFVQIPSDPL